MDAHWKELLKLMLRKAASDMHIIADQTIYLRVKGNLFPLENTGYGNDDVLEMIRQSMQSARPGMFDEYLKTGDADYSVSISSGEMRFRFNAHKERGQHALSIRHIISDAPVLESLGLPVDTPSVLMNLNGLVLVVGPSGAGKTTSMAAMVNWLNQNRHLHIITIEDPIEYYHSPNKSLITQREVGADTASFHVALRQSLRQDPDVIVVGEIRDMETMALAMSAAETGHLVIATMHAINSIQAINRVLDFFPSEQQTQYRSQLSMTLRAIYNQRLVLGTDGNRHLLVEVLKKSNQVSNLIRKGELQQLPNIMGPAYGNTPMEGSVMDLVKAGTLDRYVAEELLRELNFTY